MSEVTNANEMKELSALMISRANVYRVLSRCFREEVDVEFARELSEEFSFESTDENLSVPLNEMRTSLAGIDDDGIEQLAVIFDRVFFGMGPLTAHHAFPYESVYTSDRGIMMQEAYSQVVRTYREQKLAKDSSFTEPEDHIAVELAFMATLSDRAAAFLDEGEMDAATVTVEQQLSFIENHLLNWVDRFAVDLKKAAADGFYASLAQFTDAYVSADADLLKDMLD